MKNHIGKITLVVLCLLAVNLQLSAQQGKTVLSYDEFIENILRYHPIAAQAELNNRLAKIKMLSAKGNLDPQLKADWQEKQFNGKNYYRKYQSKLIFPTTLGFDIVGGYENTEGVYINPENKTGEFGLWHLGVEVNVLQGLLYNERRNALKQAKLFKTIAKNQQQIMLNDLLYNATATYLVWQQYSALDTVLEKNTTILDTYYQNTREAYSNGEKSAMDTLEAYMAYQDAIVLHNANKTNLIKSKRTVENFMWFEKSAVQLKSNTHPKLSSTPIFKTFTPLVDANIASHPKIQAYLNKLSALEIDQRLKREKLKPKLKVKYNPLLEKSTSDISTSYLQENFKLGIDFSMPILLRSERAAVKEGKLKIEQTKLSLDNKRNELINKVRSSWEQYAVLKNQAELQKRNIGYYKTLLDGEYEKFTYGESSVFLLTKRQEKLLNGQLKLIKSETTRDLELTNYLFYSNQLLN